MVLLVALFGVATSVAAGDLWIDCEPGLDIFLDGESVGVSAAEENGKELRGIESGEHTIRIEKDGFSPLEFSVNVGFSLNQVVIGEFAPEITLETPDRSAEEVKTELAATIEITSDPTECNVKFGDRRILKQHPILTIAGVPEGEHKLWFESSLTVLSAKVAVQASQRALVRVDFRNQQVAITDDEPKVEEDVSRAETESPRTRPECIEYWIEVLRTDDARAIEPAQAALKDQGFPHYHQKLIAIKDEGMRPVYKLRVGPVTRRNQANHVAGLLKLGGFKSAWVVPEECQEPAE
jgi:hypothetical protein